MDDVSGGGGGGGTSGGSREIANSVGRSRDLPCFRDTFPSDELFELDFFITELYMTSFNMLN